LNISKLNGGTGFYRFPVLGSAEGERCQAEPRHELAISS